jgi:hypothetical protein
MRIIETNVPDIDTKNIDKTKVEFANKIIKGLKPLLTELQISKVEEVKVLTEGLKLKRKSVLKEKEELEKLLIEYKTKQKLKKLIDRISELVSSGLVRDNQLRKETIILLKVIETLSSEKIDYHLYEITKTLTKRFAR